MKAAVCCMCKLLRSWWVLDYLSQRSTLNAITKSESTADENRPFNLQVLSPWSRLSKTAKNSRGVATVKWRKIAQRNKDWRCMLAQPWPKSIKKQTWRFNIVWSQRFPFQVCAVGGVSSGKSWNARRGRYFDHRTQGFQKEFKTPSLSRHCLPWRFCKRFIAARCR